MRGRADKQGPPGPPVGGSRAAVVDVEQLRNLTRPQGRGLGADGAWRGAVKQVGAYGPDAAVVGAAGCEWDGKKTMVLGSAALP